MLLGSCLVWNFSKDTPALELYVHPCKLFADFFRNVGAINSLTL
jgi:hypothetical protein